MKFEWDENQYGGFLHMIPETPQEVAGLAKLIMNAKAQPPEMHLSLYSEPYMTVTLRKKQGPQKDFLRPPYK